MIIATLLQQMPIIIPMDMGPTSPENNIIIGKFMMGFMVLINSFAFISTSVYTYNYLKKGKRYDDYWDDLFFENTARGIVLVIDLIVVFIYISFLVGDFLFK